MRVNGNNKFRIQRNFNVHLRAKHYKQESIFFQKRTLSQRSLLIMIKLKSHFIEFSRYAIGLPLRQCSIRQINTNNITQQTKTNEKSSSSVETTVDDFVSPIQLRGHIKEFLQSTKKRKVLPETLNKDELSGNRLTHVNLNNPVIIPNLKIVTPTIHFKKESDIRITRLSNGLRVASVVCA